MTKYINQYLTESDMYICRSSNDSNVFAIVTPTGIDTYKSGTEVANAYFRNYGMCVYGLKTADELEGFLYDRLVDNMDMDGNFDSDYSEMVTVDEIKAWFGGQREKVMAKWEAEVEA